ncbi:hypothetical protein [Actinomadura rudentiformis]|uniref:hypothetical protein n=1 Tax=Actinomadura rudentiformis TaxID=359158 RepID=UPI00298F4BF7|nr:hypothetical protein [Actinomadura rudentiformis]
MLELLPEPLDDPLELPEPLEPLDEEESLLDELVVSDVDSDLPDEPLDEAPAPTVDDDLPEPLLSVR